MNINCDQLTRVLTLVPGVKWTVGPTRFWLADGQDSVKVSLCYPEETAVLKSKSECRDDWEITRKQVRNGEMLIVGEACIFFPDTHTPRRLVICHDSNLQIEKVKQPPE